MIIWISSKQKLKTFLLILIFQINPKIQTQLLSFKNIQKSNLQNLYTAWEKI